MTTVVCDRCGKRVEFVIPYDYYLTTVKINPQLQSNQDHVDLCSVCQDRLNTIVRYFMNGADLIVKEENKDD